MSKMPIEWHKDCLVNMELNLSRERTDVEERTNRLVDREAEFRFYMEQIEEAERRGLAAFDADRLLVKRKA